MSSVQKICVGCKQIRPNNTLSLNGYHYDCEPCRVCNKTRPGVGLDPVHYTHYDCQVCSVCSKAIPGQGLTDGQHYQCEGCVKCKKPRGKGGLKKCEKGDTCRFISDLAFMSNWP